MSAQEYPITVDREGDGESGRAVIGQQQSANWTEEIIVFDAEQAGGVVRGLVAIYGDGILPTPVPAAPPAPASTEPGKPADKPADKPGREPAKK